MIKTILITAIAFSISFISFCQEEGNYILIINNDSIQIDLGNKHMYESPSGDKINIEVIQPNVLVYSDEMVSFEYDSSLSVSNVEIEEGIEQCMIVKSTGNGFMVQKYQTLDPTGLTEFMLQELTKESVSYGYSKKEKKFSKKLASGDVIEGIEATLSYNGEDEVYTVATFGEKDRGILVVTMMLNDDYMGDKEIIDLFLDTLEIK